MATDTNITSRGWYTGWLNLLIHHGLNLLGLITGAKPKETLLWLVDFQLLSRVGRRSWLQKSLSYHLAFGRSEDAKIRTTKVTKYKNRVFIRSPPHKQIHSVYSITSKKCSKCFESGNRLIFLIFFDLLASINWFFGGNSLQKGKTTEGKLLRCMVVYRL
jgi:hypothetical protein